MINPGQLKFIVNIPVDKVKGIIKVIIILDIFFLIGTGLHHSKLLFQHRHTLDLLLMEFNLGLENVLAAWYSSMLLFLVAVMAALCYCADMDRYKMPKERFLNVGWLFISLAFAILSFDEMGSFHESIGDTALFKEFGSGKMSGWYAFYISGGLVALFMFIFCLIKFKSNRKVLLFSIAGFLLYLSNPFQEKFEHYTWDHAPDPSNWHRPIFFLIMEEGSELLASLCFLCSFSAYAITATRKNNTNQENNFRLNISIKRNFVFYLFGLFVMMGLFMYLIYQNAWHLRVDDLGRPQNWFPSVVAFSAFIVAIYQYIKFRRESNKNAPTYLLLAMATIFASAYFGADIYNYVNGIFSHVHPIFLFFTTLAGFFSLLRLSGILAKVAIGLLIGFAVLSVFTKEFFNPPLYGFIAFSFLLAALFFDFKFRHKLSAE